MVFFIPIGLIIGLLILGGGLTYVAVEWLKSNFLAIIIAIPVAFGILFLLLQLAAAFYEKYPTAAKICGVLLLILFWIVVIGLIF